MFNRLITKLEVRQLRYFVGIVDARSLTRASTVLNIAQPALSQQMTHLEEILEVKLLDRSRLGVQPTTAGQALYRHAQNILRMVGETREVVTGSAEQVTGRVRLALPSSFAIMLAPPLMHAIHERYTGIKLEIYEGPSGYLPTLLLDERVDMCVVVDKPALGSAKILPLVMETLLFVKPRSETCTLAESPISLESALLHPLVLTTRATTLRQILDREFEQLGIIPKVQAEVSSIFTMLCLVQDGLGAAIVPGSALGRVAHRDRLQAYPIYPSIERMATLAVSQSNSLAPACQVVRLLLVDTIKNLVAAQEWLGARPADKC